MNKEFYEKLIEFLKDELIEAKDNLDGYSGQKEYWDYFNEVKVLKKQIEQAKVLLSESDSEIVENGMISENEAKEMLDKYN